MRRALTSRPKPDPLADLRLDDDALVGTAEACRRLGVSQKTLRVWRAHRTGPACLKLGTSKQARVLYRGSDLTRFIRENATALVR